MRDANVFAIRKALPRMSWSVQNLYNLWCRSLHPQKKVIFNRTNKTLFQQRWTAKSLMRAYHGDFINEGTFKRWYLPATLPDVRPRQQTPVGNTLALDDFAGRTEQLGRAERRKKEEDEKGLAPVGSLMVAEVERRIDVFIFRCCFAHSVYDARRMVIHGHVMLNGKKHSNSNTRLAPGDMVSVDPSVISFLQEPKLGKEAIDEATDASEASEKSEADPSPPAKHAVRPSKPSDGLTPFNLPPYASPFIFLPAYAEVSFQTCSAIYVRHPTARPGYSEIPTPYDADGEIVRLAWEWYTKRRPRNRSKTQLARMPENREVGGV
ncbi:hypothetical protein PAXINDRAFT_172615 [Paxillus involutus ATCC 200175]|uniref:RNA-binding S4 domain-containing protein n=1 Tax=Paxillus involutus ATCC 200175 TaxID=664439 RepID=A0A0C9TPL4_PAXIN|nr:hypothetical protein PAXINDRAFT_172615 [Paxillus involutus ATCC 200175]